MTSVCYFYKTTQDTTGPVPEGSTERGWILVVVREGREEEQGRMEGGIDGKTREEKNQYLQGG